MIGEATMKIQLPYLTVNRDRKGRPRYYVRKRNGPAILVKGKPGTPEFLELYQAALDLIHQGAVPRSTRPTPKTWRWLCVAYMASPEWDALSDATRAQRRNVLEAMWAEPRVPAAAELMGECPLAHFTGKAVRMLRDRKRDHPEAANHRIKCIRSVFAWAIEAEHVDPPNPARDIANLRPLNRDGHHTWTVDEVRQYERRHPLGSKPRLALALLLFTGVRRSDVVKLGRPMARDGWLAWTEYKGRDNHPKETAIPILPELQAVLDATPLTGIGTWLVTQYGKPFTVAGFGNWFRTRCNEAGLHHCTAHGLRKAGATIAAENGATGHQLQAIFGWETMKQVERYTRKVRRRKLAGEAMGLIVSKEQQP